MNWRPVTKLDAPAGYRWSDEEVLYEKNDSWLTGLVIGWVLGVTLTAILASLVCG